MHILFLLHLSKVREHKHNINNYTQLWVKAKNAKYIYFSHTENREKVFVDFALKKGVYWFCEFQHKIKQWCKMKQQWEIPHLSVAKCEWRIPMWNSPLSLHFVTVAIQNKARKQNEATMRNFMLPIQCLFMSLQFGKKYGKNIVTSFCDSADAK